MRARRQGDVIPELLADSLDVRRLIAICEENAKKRLGNGRFWCDVIALLRAVTSDDRQRITCERHRSHFEYDATAGVDRRDSLLHLGTQLSATRRAHSRESDSSE